MKKLEKDQIEALIEKAIHMMDYSYVPYSHFHVGAALLAKMAPFTAAAILKMQVIRRATVQSAPRSLKQSAKVCGILTPSALWAARIKN